MARLPGRLALAATMLALGGPLFGWCPAAAAAERGEKVPRNPEALRVCLDESRVRLHGKFGKLEPVSARVADGGVLCVLPPTAGETTITTRLVPWSELSRIDTRSRNGFAYGFERGWVVGALAGMGVLALTHPAPGDLGDIFYPMALLVGSIPFAAAGGVIGGLMYRDQEGWETCTRVRLVRLRVAK